MYSATATLPTWPPTLRCRTCRGQGRSGGALGAAALHSMHSMHSAPEQQHKASCCHNSIMASWGMGGTLLGTAGAWVGHGRCDRHEGTIMPLHTRWAPFHRLLPLLFPPHLPSSHSWPPHPTPSFYPLILQALGSVQKSVWSKRRCSAYG